MLLVQGRVLAALVLIAAFGAHYWQDKRLARRRTLPAWYLPLRLQLSSVACLCVATVPYALA